MILIPNKCWGEDSERM